MTLRSADLRLTLVALGLGATGAAAAFGAPGSPAGTLLTGLVAPALLVAAGAVALRRRRALDRRTVLLAAALGGLALLLALGARTAWSTGFDDADAGRQPGPLADAFLPLVVSGWALGTAAIAPALAPLFRDLRSRPGRALLAGWVAAVVSAALGVALALPVFAVLASITVLFLLTWRREARPAPRGARGTPWPPRVLLVLAISTLVVGGASLVVAFTGSSWPGFPGDGTRAMNVGLALAGVGAVPLIVAGGAVLRSLPRHRRSLAPAVAVASVVVGGLAQAAGAGGAAQEPLLAVGALLAGVAGSLLILPALPRFGAWQPVVFVALAVGMAASAGLLVVVAAPVLAPVAAAVVLVLLMRSDGRAGSGTGLEAAP